MHEKLGRGHSCGRVIQLTKRIFHTIWNHAEQQNWEELSGARQLSSWGQAEHWSASGEQLNCASLILCILLPFIINLPSFSVLLNCTYLNPCVLLSFFFYSFPRLIGGE